MKDHIHVNKPKAKAIDFTERAVIKPNVEIQSMTMSRSSLAHCQLIPDTEVKFIVHSLDCDKIYCRLDNDSIVVGNFNTESQYMEADDFETEIVLMSTMIIKKIFGTEHIIQDGYRINNKITCGDKGVFVYIHIPNTVMPKNTDFTYTCFAESNFEEITGNTFEEFETIFGLKEIDFGGRN